MYTHVYECECLYDECKNEQIDEKVVYFVLIFPDFQDQIFFTSQSECGRQHTSVKIILTSLSRNDSGSQVDAVEKGTSRS